MQAGCIIRVSTYKQADNTSPDIQRERILEAALKNKDLILDDDVWQVVESGKKQDRISFQLASDAVKNRGVRRVYVFKIDRLGRDMLQMQTFLLDMERAGVDVWSVDDGRVINRNSLPDLIKMVFASYELESISQRMRSGLIDHITDGGYVGGVVAFGYKVVEEKVGRKSFKYLEICEEEAKWVRQMFQWIVDEHISCQEVAERLNSFGVQTRYAKDGIGVRGKATAGVWRAGRIRNMIKNADYAGVFDFGKRTEKPIQELHHGKIPLIVDKDIWLKAQDVLTGNRLFSGRNAKREYLLRGLVVCKYCSHKFSGYFYRSNSTRPYDIRQYKCNARAQWKHLVLDEKCHSPSFRADDLEKLVWNEVVYKIQHPDLARKMIDENNPEKDIDEIRKRIDEAKLKMIFYKKERRTMLDDYTAGKVKDEEDLELYQEKQDDLKEQMRTTSKLIDGLTSRLETAESTVGERVQQQLTDLQGRIDNATYDEQYILIRELVKKVVVGWKDETETDFSVKIVWKFKEEDLPAIPITGENIVIETLTGMDSSR